MNIQNSNQYVRWAAAACDDVVLSFWCKIKIDLSELVMFWILPVEILCPPWSIDNHHLHKSKKCKKKYFTWGNCNIVHFTKRCRIEKKLSYMKFSLADTVSFQQKSFIYKHTSSILQLKYLPMILFIIIALFCFAVKV